MKIRAFSAVSKPLARVVLASLITWSSTTVSSAADLYWDTNGTTANTGTTAAGNWDGVASNWNRDADGGAASTTTAITEVADVVHFSSAANLTGAFTVTVAAGTTQLADSLKFEEGTVTLGGTGTIDIGGGTSGIEVASGRTATLGALLASSNGLVKTGAGNLMLGNVNNAGLSGTLTIKAGAIAAGSSASSSNSTNGQPISLGDTEGSASATFSVNRNQNYNSSIIVNAGSTGVKRISGGPGLTAQQTPTILSQVVLVDNLTLGNGAAGIYSGNNFAGVVLGGTITGSKKITVDGFTPFVDAQSYANNLGNATLAVTVARINGGNVGSFTGEVEVVRGVLNLSGTGSMGSANPVSIGAGAALDVQNNVTIAGLRDLTGGGGTVVAAGSARTLTLGGSGSFSFSGALTNPLVVSGTTTTGLSLTVGDGINPTRQTLSGANSYSGVTTITSGAKLTIGSPTALGTNGVIRTAATGGTTVAAGGTLDLNGQTAINEVFTLNGAGTGDGAIINGGSAAAGIAGGMIASLSTTVQVAGLSAVPTLTISGGGGSGAAATALGLGLTAASFTIDAGTTTVYSAAPAVAITGGGGSGASATAILTAGVVTGVTITNIGSGYTSAPTLAFTGGTVTTAGVNPTATGNATHFTLSGIQLTANGAGYTSPPTVSVSEGTGTIVANLSTITLAADTAIGGSGDLTIGAPISGAFALTKVGSNQLTLAGANVYSGPTTVDSGKLNVSGGITSAVEVKSSGSIGGSGMITGNVHVALGGHFAGELASTAAVQVPLKIDGTLVLDLGSIVDIKVVGLPAPGIYKLASATGGVTAALGVVNLPGITGTVSVNGNDLVLTVVGGGGTGYAGWALIHAGGQPANQDYDNDGTSNGIEYFMNSSAGFTANPGLVAGTVTWPNGGNIPSSGYGTRFLVQTSADLAIWTNVPLAAVTNTAAALSYTPAAPGRSFVRLVVTPE